MRYARILPASARIAFSSAPSQSPNSAVPAHFLSSFRSVQAADMTRSICALSCRIGVVGTRREPGQREEGGYVLRDTDSSVVMRVTKTWEPLQHRAECKKDAEHGAYELARPRNERM